MTLNRRERLAGLLTATLVGLLFLDRFLVTPYQARRDRLLAEQQALLAEISRGRAMISQWRAVAPSWEERWSGEWADEGGATLNALREWAEGSRLTLTLLRPEGRTAGEQWEENVFQVVAAGSMRNVARFLWRVESADLPLKIKDLQLTARREGEDDLSLQVRVGTLAPVAGAAGSTAATGAVAAEAVE